MAVAALGAGCDAAGLSAGGLSVSGPAGVLMPCCGYGLWPFIGSWTDEVPGLALSLGLAAS